MLSIPLFSLKQSDFEEVAQEEAPAPSQYQVEVPKDEETRLKVLALGKEFIRKKSRSQLIDAAYHRFAYDDSNLPEWFVAEEMKHRELFKPPTKEEMARLKQHMREIDARPVKKVAEAKARKYKKASEKVERLRKKAEAIADSAESTTREKMQSLSKLYKSSLRGDKNEGKVKVLGRVNRTGRGGVALMQNGKQKIVDTVMKKTKRMEKIRDRKKAHKRR